MVKSVDQIEQAVDRELDITADTCPMTFVRTRLALDKMTPGQLLRVRLRPGEPLQNVPKAAENLGHSVLAIRPTGDGSFHVTIRKMISGT